MATAVGMFRIATEWMQSDVPEARKCGMIISIAWRDSAQQPCSEAAHAAAEKMNAIVPLCRQLRQGEEYVASYGELLRASDKWCGGPHCSDDCKAKKDRCFRESSYPFAPKCSAGLEALPGKTECSAGFVGATPDARCAAAISFVRAGLNASGKTAPKPPSEELSWEELNKEQQAGASKLGYGAKEWDQSVAVDSEGKDWKQLNKQEQEGAMTLGWTQASWDKDAVCQPVNSHVEKLEEMEERCLSGTPRPATCWGEMKAVLPFHLEKARKTKAEMDC